MATSRIITAAVVRSLGSMDPTLSVPQVRVLVLLSSTPEMNLSGLAERVGVNPSNASRTCDRLVGAGLVTRRDNPEDRRHVTLALSAEGDRVVRDLMGRREQLLSQVVSEMTPSQRTQLMSALEAFNEAAQGVSSIFGDTHDAHSVELLPWLT